MMEKKVIKSGGVELKLPNQKPHKIIGASTGVALQFLHKTSFYDDLNSVTAEFKNESDRALVILGCAAIDELLKQLIKIKLIEVASNNERLLKNGACSTFNARLELAFRIGLISNRLRNDLIMLKFIRNEFAHNIKNHKLSELETSNKIKTILKGCHNLTFNFKMVKREITEREMIASFISAVMITLNNKLVSEKKLIECESEGFLYPKTPPII